MKGEPYHLFHDPYLTIGPAVTILVCVMTSSKQRRP